VTYEESRNDLADMARQRSSHSRRRRSYAVATDMNHIAALGVLCAVALFYMQLLAWVIQ
jgi:hypothetical protein